MKVLLIDTPFRGWEETKTGRTFSGVQNFIPSLGLAYVAAAAEADGHQIGILDIVSCPGREELLRRAGLFAPEVIGFNGTTPTFRKVASLAADLSRRLPAARMVLGGSHATAAPEHAASSRRFDYLVLGEGEETFRGLLRHLEKGDTRHPEEIPGIAVCQGGETALAGASPLISDLNTLPFPARHLLPPLASYSPTPASLRRPPLVHLMTSRGCPTPCRFCDRSIFGMKYRDRSAENVLAEIEHVISRLGAREIRFFDDTLTLNKRRLVEICEGIRKNFPGLPWTCNSKIAAIDPEILKIMKASGCWQILFGLESGDDRVLESLGKNTTVEANRRAVLMTVEAGIGVRGDFLVGTPEETEDSFLRTVEFAVNLPLDFAHFNKFTPYPGTQFYRDIKARGYDLPLDGVWNDEDHFDFIYSPPALPSARLGRLMDIAYRRFYMRPRFLVRRLRDMRSWAELSGHARGFFTLSTLERGGQNGDSK